MSMAEITTGQQFHQMTIDEYLMAQQEIAQRLMNMSDDYIAIGYLLRQIDESEAYRQEGYESLKDFAKDKYNMSESSVSRFININKEFSKHGYSKQISEDYRGYGVSKLTELLNMSQDDRQLVTASTTVATIREIKDFNREAEQMEEQQIPGQQNIEDTIEAYERGDFVKTEIVEAEIVEQVPVNTRTWSDLETILIEFFRDKMELLNDIYGLSLSTVENVVEKINPSGNLNFRHKTLFLFMYGYAEGVILKKMGTPNVNYTWQQVVETIVEIYKDTYTDHDTVHQNFYKCSENDKNVSKQIENDTKTTESESIEPSKAAVEEYRTPHPEGITSICYSCTEYETCNVKFSTCTSCDQYKNRAEAYKTDEERYSEEQEKIDKETAKKLKDMADEERLSKLASDEGPVIHQVKMGTDMFEEAYTNKRNFELVRKSEEYNIGDLIEMYEYNAASPTGRECTKIVLDIWEDVMGLDDNYCILSVAPTNEDNEALQWADISGICRDIKANALGYTEDNEDYILVEDAVGHVKSGGIA